MFADLLDQYVTLVKNMQVAQLTTTRRYRDLSEAIVAGSGADRCGDERSDDRARTRREDRVRASDGSRPAHERASEDDRTARGLSQQRPQPKGSRQAACAGAVDR